MPTTSTTRTLGAVFISHTHQDIELARDIARRLRDASLQPWILDAPIPGELKKAIREKIRGADAVLVLVTPAALRSAWIMTELGMAEGFERPIVAVSAGLKSSDLPLPLKSYRVVPFDKVDEAIQALSEKLSPMAKH